MELTIEKMSEEFTKYHLHGLPFPAVLHHFTAPDKGGPHDHPFGFTSFVLKGGYLERVYHPRADGTWDSYVAERVVGTSHRVSATHIHEIIDLPEGGCWTLILPQAWEREWRFWRFDAQGWASRQWNEPDFPDAQQ